MHNRKKKTETGQGENMHTIENRQELHIKALFGLVFK